MASILKEARMKSFDEVTKALSICGRLPDCKGCPYKNVPYPTEIGNTCKDIMHYDALYYMQNRIDECQEANSPLTWDELKQMRGKAVWIEGTHHNHWCIIKGIARKDLSEMEYITLAYLNNKNRIVTYDRRKGNFDVTWQAYRKEKYE